MSNLDGSDDVFDSREVIERIEELHAEIGDNTAPDDYVLERDELATLEAFAAEAEGYASDWHYGATFIRDSYFEDYARELADDLGIMPSDDSWPASYIDWEAAADALKMDYTTVEFWHETYWVR